MRKLLFIICCLLSLHTYADHRQLRYLYSQAEYFRIRDLLNSNDPYIPQDAKLFYSAVTSNAFNKNADAIVKADSFLRVRSFAWTDMDIIQMLQVKMDSYAKLYRYADVVTTCNEILTKYAGALNDHERGGIINTYNIYKPLADAPPLSIKQTAEATIPITRNMYGLSEIPVNFEQDKPEMFIFDTGANMSVITESMAEKVGIKRRHTSFKVNASQGKTVTADIGIADSFSMGGITIRNAIFIIMPDENLDFPKQDFSIRGIIGFPVIDALKEVHIYRDGFIKIPLRPAPSQLNNLVLRGLTPIVQAVVSNDTMIFQFDTGEAQTSLYSPFYQKYSDWISENGKRTKKVFSGAGGSKAAKVYELSNLKLRIGVHEFTLPTANVFTEPILGTRDITYGSLGHDVAAQFSQTIINFDNMYLDFK